MTTGDDRLRMGSERSGRRIDLLLLTAVLAATLALLMHVIVALAADM